MIAEMGGVRGVSGAMIAAMGAAFLLLIAGPTSAACINCLSTALANEAIYSGLAANEGNFSVTGLVQGVSYAQNVVEVQGGAGKETIHITPTTTIDKHGQTGSIADIRPGVHITVDGVVRDGQKVALTIQIK
jgi:hypothetical protein